MEELIEEKERKQIIQKYLDYRLLKIPRSFLAHNYQLLIILSQALLVNSFDDLQKCTIEITCPTYSSADYFLYVDSCFKELNYGIWSECRCPQNAVEIFNKVSNQISQFACGTVSYNAANCITSFFNYTVGTFHDLVFKRDTDQAEYNSFDSCVINLINNAYQESQLPWLSIAYVALGIAGCCALGGAAYGGIKLAAKWYANHQRQKRITDAPHVQNIDETSPLLSL